MPFLEPISRAVLIFAVGCLFAPQGWAAGDGLHVDLGGEVALELVEIAPGEFTQGSKAGEPGHKSDEAQRQVGLTRKFYLGKYPVTFGQFSRFVQETNYKTEAEKGSSGGYGWTAGGLVQQKGFSWRNPGFAQTPLHPVTLVTYGDAKAFLSWLSHKSGRQFVLPTEAQWEYACRAGTTTAWPNGDDPAGCDAIAWSKANAGAGTMPVGQKPLNAWGLGDMLGNVWEWCEDWYAAYPPGPVTDPVQTNSQLSDKPRRVLRGGSWMRERLECRSASRYRNDPASRNPDNGFRVATFDSESTPVNSPTPSTKPAPTGTPPLQLERSSALGMPEVRHEWTPSPTAAISPGVHVLRGGLGFPLAFAVFVGILALLGRLLRRGINSSIGGGSSTTGRITTRIGDDGFWVTGQNLAVGTILLCRYRTDGGEQESRIAYEPGPEGQFVYTGQRPSNVTVIIGGESSAFGGEPMLRNVYPSTYMTPSRSTPFDSQDDRPISSRNPPAY